DERWPVKPDTRGVHGQRNGTGQRNAYRVQGLHAAGSGDAVKLPGASRGYSGEKRRQRQATEVDHDERQRRRDERRDDTLREVAHALGAHAAEATLSQLVVADRRVKIPPRATPP